MAEIHKNSAKYDQKSIIYLTFWIAKIGSASKFKKNLQIRELRWCWWPLLSNRQDANQTGGLVLSRINRKVIRPWVQASWKVYSQAAVIKPECLTWCVVVFEKEGEKPLKWSFLYTVDEENQRSVKTLITWVFDKKWEEACKRKKHKLI